MPGHALHDIDVPEDVFDAMLEQGLNPNDPDDLAFFTGEPAGDVSDDHGVSVTGWLRE